MRRKAQARDGYVTLVVVFMLTMIAVLAFAINRRAGVQLRMARNAANAIQGGLRVQSAITYAEWRLDADRTWRTPGTGVAVRVAGEWITLKTQDISLDGYDAAVRVVVDTAAQTSAATAVYAENYAAYRVYIADRDNNRIRVVETNGTIRTFAGTGATGATGDGGAATNATLNAPRAVAVDADGRIFIADTGNHRIRVVYTNGVIGRFAGNGTNDFGGDGGGAGSAALSAPEDVIVAEDGVVYIADTGNHRVRRVATNGVITTVAGNGTAAFAGDGGLATAASLDEPSGVHLYNDAYLIIADRENCVVRLVQLSSGRISTYAGRVVSDVAYCGCEGPRLREPTAIAVNGYYLYIVDRANHRVVRATSGNSHSSYVNGVWSCWLGGLFASGDGPDGGPAAYARLHTPTDLAFTTGGDLVIADRDNDRIRMVDADSLLLSTLAGTGSSGFWGDGGAATAAQLNDPSGVAVQHVFSGLQRVAQAY